jgi:hypothetical protein
MVNRDKMLVNREAPLPGQILPNLTKIFHAPAKHGKDGFYKGCITVRIVFIAPARLTAMNINIHLRGYIAKISGTKIMIDNVVVIST